MYPAFLFYSKHLLQLKHKPTDRNGWTLFVCNTFYREKYIYISCTFVLVFHKKPSLRLMNRFNTCIISMQIILIKKKKRKKRKKISLQLFGKRALPKTLKINERILTKVKCKLRWGFKTLKRSKLFNTKDHNDHKSQLRKLFCKLFIEKMNLKFSATGCSFKINSAVLSTHPQVWCMSRMVYNDIGL